MTATVMLSIAAAVCLVAAILAWRRARRLARRLDELSQFYWELRYEVGELRVQIERRTGSEASAPGQPAKAQTAGGEGFVPLASLKR
jgi:hypothetical protein